MATIAEALAVALHYHQAGNLEYAEQVYRQILQADPDNTVALHLLTDGPNNFVNGVRLFDIDTRKEKLPGPSAR